MELERCTASAVFFVNKVQSPCSQRVVFLSKDGRYCYVCSPLVQQSQTSRSFNHNNSRYMSIMYEPLTARHSVIQSLTSQNVYRANVKILLSRDIDHHRSMPPSDLDLLHRLQQLMQTTYFKERTMLSAITEGVPVCLVITVPITAFY